MHSGMKNPRALIIRCYAPLIIDINEYLASFPGVNLNDKIGVTELNEILLKIMINSWFRQAYEQGFDCESINFKKYVNMFEPMEIAESIYEVVVEPSYKKPTRADTNPAVHSRQKRGEADLSWTCPKKGESAGKCRQRHVDSLTGK